MSDHDEVVKVEEQEEVENEEADGEDEDEGKDKGENEGEDEGEDKDEEGKEEDNAVDPVQASFDWHDGDKDGKITAGEMFDAWSVWDPSMTEKGAGHWVKFFDANEDDAIDIGEFRKAFEARLTVEEEVDGHFRIADVSPKDDLITVKEARAAFKHLPGGFTKEDAKEFMEAAGEDKQLSKEELRAVLGAGQQEQEEGDDDFENNKDVLEAEENLHSSQMTEGAGQRRLIHFKRMEHLLERFDVKHGRLSSTPGSSFFTPAAGGFIMVPLLVAAFGCRRRLRTPAATPEFEEVAEE